MSIDLTVATARRGDAWLRHQRAQFEQRHLQFGRHCRLDMGCLLLRAADRARVAPPVEVVTRREDFATEPVRHSKLDIADYRMLPKVDDITHALVRPLSRAAAPPLPNCHRVQGPATLGDFVASARADAVPLREWTATLADFTTVVVSDCSDSPNAVDVEKAVATVQSRAYIEHRARRLLLPFTKEGGSWRLVTIDFGAEARRHGCEFLMGFAFRATNGVLSITCPSVEIGLALSSPAAVDPTFVLTVVSADGFPS